MDVLSFQLCWSSQTSDLWIKSERKNERRACELKNSLPIYKYPPFETDHNRNEGAHHKGDWDFSKTESGPYIMETSKNPVEVGFL